MKDKGGKIAFNPILDKLGWKKNRGEPSESESQNILINLY
jgi:hypothetical protein